MKHSIAKIISTGLLVGTLDISAACIQYFIKTGKGPEGVLQFVASGFFGQKAFDGGSSMIAAGLLFHYIIAMLFTVFFFAIAPILFSLLKNKLLVGILYGIFIWCVMNLIVVPLSSTPKFPFKPVNAAIAAAILVVCIGIPLSFIAGRSLKKES